ncbi:hypothetical protein [Paenibacillus oceani]|uniref:Uncharacterized protein n=1 Tax=Paenibacillus oceani TaxID=2772510 RepID=A0A927CBW1_9BACL|nr:hypothetical protein [Paenibacillus oceani]MBD2864810.1 hypothetical protein [Paenibacillus oceani]
MNKIWKMILIIVINMSLMIMLVVTVKDEIKKHIDVKEAEETDVLTLLHNDNQVLYEKSTLKQEYIADSKIDAGKIVTNNSVLSSFDTINPVSEHVFLASGWIYADEDVLIDSVIFVDSSDNIVGAANYGFDRPGLSQALQKANADKSGWKGYIYLKEQTTTTIRAYGKIKNTNELILIKSEKQIEMKGNIVVKEAEETDVLTLLHNDNQVLYEKSTLKQEYKANSKINAEKIVTNTLSSFDSIIPVSEYVFLATGWIYAGEDVLIDSVIFVDSSDNIVGAANYGYDRPGLSQALQKTNADKSGWQGYIYLKEKTTTTIRAYGRIKNTNELVLINSEKQIEFP